MNDGNITIERDERDRKRDKLDIKRIFCLFMFSNLYVEPDNEYITRRFTTRGLDRYSQS